MKKFVSIISLLFICFNFCNAQLPPIDHPRGLYIDKFFYFIRGTNNQNTNNSILGNTTKENELLQYCLDNHITYITLYDIPKIFSTYGTSNWAGYSSMLSHFICKAKTDYCIKTVGAALGTPGDFNVVDNYNDIVTPPFPFQDPDKLLPEYSQLSFVEQTHLQEDPLFGIAEYTKMILRMAYFNDPTYNLTTSTCGNNNIDVLNLEYEFWNPDGYYYFGTNPGADPNRTLQDKLLYMDLTKTLYNSSHTDKLYTELYLGTLDDDWSNGSGTFDNHCKIAEYLDGMYNATDRRIDRFVTTYYSFYYVNLYNPGGMGSLDQNYEYRYADFCEENNSYVSSAQCSTPIITNNNTDIHPLFSAEDPFKGAEKGSVFLGNYLGARSDQNITGTYSEQNIFSAERSLQKYTSPSQLFTLSNN